MGTDWWLKYAEYHCLLFIDFKLKGVMAHGLRACTYSHVLECVMIYSKSRKWVLVCSMPGGVCLHISLTSHSLLICLNTHNHLEVHSKIEHLEHTVAPYRRFSYVMGLFHLAQRDRPSGKTSNSYRPTLLLPTGLYFNLLQITKSSKSRERHKLLESYSCCKLTHRFVKATQQSWEIILQLLRASVLCLFNPLQTFKN